MGEIFGAGMSHYPGFHAKPQFLGQQILGNIERSIKKGWAPESWRDKENWPQPLLQEWSDDEGLSAGIKHRAAHQDAVTIIKQRLDEFNPDFVLIWGDDQWENFHDDLVPPFAVYAWEELELGPIGSNRLGGGNAWDEPPEKELTHKGHPKAAKYLVEALMDEGFDIPYSYRPLHRPHLAHAFKNTLIYLDEDRRGFNYPVIPFHINCYGERFVLSRGVGGPVPDEAERDVKAPSPKRCFEMGQAVARVIKASPYRAAVIGSSSWSHGGLVRDHDYIYPDVNADRRLYEHLSKNDLTYFRDITTAELIKAGQVELPNWCAVIGAMYEAGHKANVLSYSETHLFNSSKAVALFSP